MTLNASVSELAPLASLVRGISTGPGQTFATTETRTRAGKGSGRGGRVRTRFRVPPVSPSSGAVTSGVVPRHLDPVELPEVLLVSEMAELLRVHPSTVYALCDRGELPHLKVSGCIRIHRAGVEDFVRATGEQASERES